MEDIQTPPAIQEVPEEMTPRGHHTKPLRVFLIILLIILVGWGVFALFQQQPTPDKEQNYTVQTAEQGQLVGSFPRELIPESAVAIISSSELTYTDRTEQLPTAEYASAKTLEENITLFHDLLTQQGWTIVKEATPTDGSVTNMYATKDGNDVNVTFITNDTGVDVHIAYVRRQ